MSTLNATNLKNASSGSNNIVLNSDGTTTIASPSNIIKSGTAVASTSGTSIDFTSIPSWVKRVTVMFNGVSTNGSSNHLVQIGSGSFLTSGYVSGSTMGQSGIASGTSTAGFLIHNSTSAAFNYSGTCSIVTLGSNAWVYSSLVNENVGRFAAGGGNVTLSGTLDRVRITTSNGTDTFDAGSINILYEG